MLEPEIKALRAVVRALEPLDATTRRRVIGYLYEALADGALVTPTEQAPAEAP